MNRRLTPAWRASAAIVSGSPASMVASRAVITRPVLSAESSRRRATSRLVCSAAVSSAMVNVGGCGQFDGGKEHWRVLADQAGQLGWEAHGEVWQLGADWGDGRLDGCAVGLVSGVEPSEGDDPAGVLGRGVFSHGQPGRLRPVRWWERT